MTPYQIVVKFMQHTLKDIYEIFWKDGSRITGQTLISDIHQRLYDQELVSIRARQGHSGNNMDMPTLTQDKIEKKVRTISAPPWNLKT